MKNSALLSVLTLYLLIFFNIKSQAQHDSLRIILPDRPELILDKLEKFNPSLPDTLFFDEFSLVVEHYSSKGTYNNRTRQFTGLSGYGRILFQCNRSITSPVFPWELTATLSDQPLIPQAFLVVDSVVNSQKEIALKDARYLEKDARVGSELTLMLPQRPDKAEKFLADYLDQSRIRFRRPRGIRFSFEKIDVVSYLPRRRAGKVIKGMANYPTIDSIPKPPFQLKLDGFTLEVEKMTVFHDKAATAMAKLILPGSISTGNDCSRASLDLGKIKLNQQCEFYRTYNNKNYGIWNIANTNLTIKGTGFTADFTTNSGTSPTGTDDSWRGLILHSGETLGKPSGTIIANTGYIGADYLYSTAQIDKNGFSGDLETNKDYNFTTIQPFNNTIAFKEARLSIFQNKINGGWLKGVTFKLSELAVMNPNGSPVIIRTPQLNIENDMSIAGEIPADSLNQNAYFWGEFRATGSQMMTYGIFEVRKGVYYIPGDPSEEFYPLAGDLFTDIRGWQFTIPFMRENGIHGLSLYDPSFVFIHSPDLPGANTAYPLSSSFLIYSLGTTRDKKVSWINVNARGVHAGLYAPKLGLYQDYLPVPFDIGNPSSPYYEGNVPFKFSSIVYPDETTYGKITIQFVESAVFHSDVEGGITLPVPVNDTLKIDELVFTSTAHISGGKIDLSESANLDYWGLEMVQKEGHSSAGVLSVKTGQVIITAAGLAEPRHFSEPFNVNWGELLADGNKGRLFFDYHTAGQQFDHIDYNPEAITLSDYDPARRGFLRTGGTIFYPFFGGKYLHIIDYYDPGKPGAPFDSREIAISTSDFGSNFFASDLHVAGNWSEDMAVFEFDLRYNDVNQYGFLGDGLSDLAHLIGGAMNSSIVIKGDYSCISIKEKHNRILNFDAATDITQIADIWGCMCIHENQIENLVYGGSLTASTNLLMVGMRSGQYAQLIVRETPAISEFTIDGQATLSALGAADLLVNGHFNMLYNRDEKFIEGEVSALFRTAAGLIFTGSSLSGQGQANWHISLDPLAKNAYQSIQGSIGLSVMGYAASVTAPFTVGASSGLNAGFYYGLNAPRDEAWVIKGGNPRYQFEMSSLPDRLTGVYGFIQFSNDINIFLVSGGYEIFAGFGAFLNTDYTVPVPYAVGNLGGRIHGEILGGLVGAGAYFNMQVALGAITYGFEGTVGLEGCVLWVFCGSVDITVGLNQSRGFYIE